MSKRAATIRLIAVVICTLFGATVFRNLAVVPPKYEFNHFGYAENLLKESYRVIPFVVTGSVVGALIALYAGRFLVQLSTRQCVDILALVLFFGLFIFYAFYDRVLIPPWEIP